MFLVSNGLNFFDEALLGLALFGGLLMALGWMADRYCGDNHSKKNSLQSIVARDGHIGGWSLIVIALCLEASLAYRDFPVYRELFLYSDLFYFNLFKPINLTDKPGVPAFIVWNSGAFLAFAFSVFAAFYAKSPKLPLRYGLTLPLLLMTIPAINGLLSLVTQWIDMGGILTDDYLPLGYQWVSDDHVKRTVSWLAYLNLLAVFSWGILYGNHQNNRTITILALIGFLISILVIYLGLFGRLLSSSMLLLVAGLVMIIFAAITYWWAKLKKGAR